MEDLKQKLKQALSGRTAQRILNPSLPKSAVLMPISYKQGQYYILFTKRTQSVKYHKGEMSFPGGVYEEGDGTLVNTALRESYEEIGLAPADVEILGQLDDIVTRVSSFIVSPFVAFIPSPYQFKLNPKEAEALAEVPIMALLDKARMREEPAVIINGKTVITYVYYYGDTVITGATARILRQFLDIFAQVTGKGEATGKD